MYAQLVQTDGLKKPEEMSPEERAFQAVSYTHLTLPTN